MRLVVINAHQRYYAVFEGRQLVAGLVGEDVLEPQEVEDLRLMDVPKDSA